MASDKAQRSIFVGNIPYDVSETKLREIFSKVGPISSFRLVFDKETGKPKGYGFCEYFDIETAQSALRNLPNCDINGRPLRIGPAAGEQHFGPSNESTTTVPPTTQPPNVQVTAPQPSAPNADWSDSVKVTQLIGNAVSSMPPESLGEMLRSVKYFAVTNPGEARLMLVGNPSLAYALLQALIVTRAIDARTVPLLLHRPLSVEEKFIPPPQPQRNPYAPPNIFYDPSSVKNSSPPNHGIGDYPYAPRDGYYPPAQIPEPYHPETGGKYSYRDAPPARKRRIRSNFDPRNLPRFSTSVLKSICSSSRGRCSVDDHEKEMIVGQLLGMSDEQIERCLPREQIELAFTIRRRP